MFFLKLAKPDEIEILPPVAGPMTLTTSKPDSVRKTGQTRTRRQRPRPVARDHPHRPRVPIYRKLGPFQTKRLREIIHSVIANLDPNSVEDVLPSELRQRQDLITRAQALTEIHFPPEELSDLRIRNVSQPGTAAADLRRVFLAVVRNAAASRRAAKRSQRARSSRSRTRQRHG